MPEVGIPNTEFSDYMAGLFREKTIGGLKAVPREKHVVVARTFGEEYLHRGGCCFVMGTADPDKVKAVTFRPLSPIQAKAQFYVQRIFTTVFPEYFPRFHAAFGSNSDGNITGTIRERVYPGNEPASIFEAVVFRLKRKSFKKVRQLCEKWDIPLDFDWKKDNLMVDGKGRERYVDALAYGFYDHTDYPALYASLPNVLDYMKANKYSCKEIEIVEKSLERLKVNGFLGQASCIKAEVNLKPSFVVAPQAY